MQSHYAASFDREMGCTEVEWLSWLPGAVGDHPLTIDVRRATVDIGAGHLQLRWQALSPRQIALARLPRLAVEFRFDDLDEAARWRFMRYFDLYTQRGGG